MKCLTTNPAAQRYMRRNLIAMFLYALTLALVIPVFLRFHPTGVLAYLLAVLPAIPLTGLLVVFGIYLAEEKDEFQRFIGVQAMLWGIGGTLAVTNIWGFLESFVHLRHLNPILDAVIFWIFVGISIPFLLRRYR